VTEAALADENFQGGAFGELRRSLRDDSLVVVPMPALSIWLLHIENQKGSPLTEEEVLAAVERAPAITMTAEDAAQFAQRMDGPDLDPDNVWAEWQAFRGRMAE
jgi:hypothetical protein